MDNVSWGVFALALTVLAGIWTWFAFRNRGFASGIRGAGVTLLPIAAYLTHTLRMLGRVGSAVADWATGFVFSPAVWLGIIMGGAGILLFILAGKLPGGSKEVASGDGGAKAVSAGRSAGRAGGRSAAARPTSGTTQAGPAAGDDDFSDIQAILKKHGIS